MADDNASLRQHFLKYREGHMGTAAHLLEKPVPMRLKYGATIPTHLRRPDRTGSPRPICPLHYARRSDPETGRYIAAALARTHRRNDPFPKIV